jgi:hypothetical protein
MSGLEPDTNLPRLLAHALEDECTEPLKELRERAPDERLRFSGLERALSEWSFAYGVAWTLARVRDPFLSSTRVAAVAEAATREAWRSQTGQDFWAAPALSEEEGTSPPSVESVTRVDEFTTRLGSMRSRPGGQAAGTA